MLPDPGKTHVLIEKDEDEHVPELESSSVLREEPPEMGE